MAKVTVNMTQAVTGTPFQVVGTADDTAQATNEAVSKVAATVGTVVSVSVSENLDDISAFVPAAGDDADAVIIVGKTGNANRNIKVSNATKAMVLPNSKGKINPANPLAAAIAAAYRDGDGNGGYTVVGGQYEK